MRPVRSPSRSQPCLYRQLPGFDATFGVTLTAYIIASGIPIFGGLVSLVGALLGTLLSFQPMYVCGCMITGLGVKRHQP